MFYKNCQYQAIDNIPITVIYDGMFIEPLYSN